MKIRNIIKLAPLYAVILSLIILFAYLGTETVTVLTQNAVNTDRMTIIIDPGHGGIDTGATSCTGVMESEINLEIALKLNDLLQLLGYQTKMIRTSDISIFTEGDSIAAKKISDLKNRVQIVNETEKAVLISIHQNYFPVERYSGAQVFYHQIGESEQLAKFLQKNIVSTINPGSNRQAKKASGVYLLQNIQKTAVLVECGFLSNPEEERQLRDATYQKKLCGVIASAVSSFLKENVMT